jgi:hypothetical protein
MQTKVQQELENYQHNKTRQEELEHRDVLLAIRSIFKQKEGLKFFKYLLKNLDVGMLPERGMTGENLSEYLGFLRAGNSIYKLACETDSETTASLMAQIEKEKHEDAIHLYRIKNGLTISNDDE